MSDTPDLKPCPFCGAKPIVYEIEPHEHSVVGLPKFGGAYVVECALCNVGFTGETMEDVLYAWNRRPPHEENPHTL